MLSMANFDLKKFFLRWRMYLLAVVVAAVVVALLWCVPPWLVERAIGRLDKPDAVGLATLEDTYRRTLAQILGGLGLLYGLYLTWRRVRAVEEGQITERFTRAIEQLGQRGPDKMAIRLGGIYALERIARDSEKDHGPIMEVLTAYVRENAPRHGEYAEKVAAKPPTDIQAILTVIGRRETTGKNRRNDRLDLRHTHLAGVVILDADLQGADLQGAALNRTILVRAKLGGANLGWDLPNRTKLIVADLTGANLTGANLTGANLTGADLSETTLIGADLTDTLLIDAKNLTAGQVQSAKNWRKEHLPDYLKDIPEPLV